MRMLNVPMRLVLALPFTTPLSRRLILLTYRGRRSGKQYRQPLSYVRHHNTLLTPGGGKWTLNLVDGRAEHVRLGGRDVILYPELVSTHADVQNLIAIMSETNPMVRRFIAIPQQPDGTLDRAKLQAAIDHGFRIVRGIDHPPPERSRPYAHISRRPPLDASSASACQIAGCGRRVAVSVLVAVA